MAVTAATTVTAAANTTAANATGGLGSHGLLTARAARVTVLGSEQ